MRSWRRAARMAGAHAPTGSAGGTGKQRHLHLLRFASIRAPSAPTRLTSRPTSGARSRPSSTTSRRCRRTATTSWPSIRWCSGWGRGDRQRRDLQAARPVVVGADRDVRRRSREDAVRLSRSTSGSEGVGALPRRRQAGVRHATRRLDLPARPAGARLVPAGRDPGRRLRRQRAREDQRLRITASTPPRRPPQPGPSKGVFPVSTRPAICGRAGIQPETNLRAPRTGTGRWPSGAGRPTSPRSSAIVDIDASRQDVGGRGAD